MLANDGVPPRVWGQCAWSFIHHVALGYPHRPTERHIHDYTAFFASLPNVLPCKKCRINLNEHLAHAPPDAALRAGKRELFDWTVSLHNTVNKALNKPKRNSGVMYTRYCETVHAVRNRTMLAARVTIGLLLISLLTITMLS